MSQKSTGTPLQRLTATLRRTPALPSIAPAIVHLFDRYVAGAADPDEADHAIAKVLAKHKISREELAPFVADYKQVPETVRARFTPPELLKAKTATPLSRAQRPAITLSRGDVLSSASPAASLSKLPAPAAEAPAPPLTRKPPPLAQLGRLVARRQVPSLPAPYLRSIEEPAGSYEWGEVITLRGSFPELTTAAAGVYRAYTLVRFLGEEPIVTELTIAARREGELDVRLDSTRRQGWAPAVWVSRTVSGYTFNSNSLPLELEVKPPAEYEPLPTRIDEITPAQRYSGDRVVLRGKNLHTAAIEWSLLDAEEAPPLLLTPLRLSATDVEVQLPAVMVAGTYRVRCVGAFAVGSPSNVVVYELKAHHFRIDLIQISCPDLTYPDSDKDDLVTVWATAGDNLVYGGTTGEITLDEGESRTFLPGSYTLFGLAAPAPVRATLAAHVDLWEWDDASPEAVQKFLGALTDLAIALAPLLTSMPIATIIAEVSKVLMQVVSWVAAWRKNIHMGTFERAWTIDELLALTNNPAAAFTVSHQFHAEDGRSDLTFRISRHRPVG